MAVVLVIGTLYPAAASGARPTALLMDLARGSHRFRSIIDVIQHTERSTDNPCQKVAVLPRWKRGAAPIAIDSV
jgi:hypothetical protein